MKWIFKLLPNKFKVWLYEGLYRDIADQAWTASQNERDRGFQLAMAALQSQHDKEYFEMQVDAENGRSLSSFIWEMIT